MVGNERYCSYEIPGRMSDTVIQGRNGGASQFKLTVIDGNARVVESRTIRFLGHVEHITTV